MKRLPAPVLLPLATLMLRIVVDDAVPIDPVDRASKRRGQILLRKHRPWIVALAGLWMCWVATVAPAAIIRTDAFNYRSALKRLVPGDTLQLTAGVYIDGLDIHGLNGTTQLPIIVE